MQGGRGMNAQDGSGPLTERADRKRSGDLAPGEIASEISRSLVQLYAKRLGRGPTKTRAVATTNVVTVIFEDTLTRAEQTLIQAGHGDTVVETRQTLAKAIQDDATAAVESATNRRVASMVSGVDVEANVSVAVFVLDSVAETGQVGIGETDPGLAG
jgi:uncharacterized protein YbcI